MKKYSNSTKCYKIDIFVNGVYECSTDSSKTCKAAKLNYLQHYYKLKYEDVKCHFDKN